MSQLGKTIIGVVALSIVAVVLSITDIDTILAGDQAGDPHPLFSQVPEPAGYEPDNTPEITRSRLVSVDFDLISDPQISQVLLNLFEDTSYEADRHRLAGQMPLNFTWVGRIQEVEHGQVTLVIRDGGVMVGNIILPGTIYQIRYLGDGIHVVSQLDDRSLPPHHDPIPVASPTQTEAGDTLAAVAEGEDDGTLIDVMVVSLRQPGLPRVAPPPWKP